jgi:hypothetical protein
MEEEGRKRGEQPGSSILAQFQKGLILTTE